MRVKLLHNPPRKRRAKVATLTVNQLPLGEQQFRLLPLAPVSHGNILDVIVQFSTGPLSGLVV